MKENLKKIDTVFFDLDGVLADWVESFESTFDITIEEFNKLSKSERSVFKKLLGYDHYRNLKLLNKGFALYHYLVLIFGTENVKILSAYGDYNKYDVIKAKKEWVAEHLGPDVETLFVQKVDHKGIHANPTTVLIDDRQKAVDAFSEAGGIGVLFE